MLKKYCFFIFYLFLTQADKKDEIFITLIHFFVIFSTIFFFFDNDNN